MNALYVLTTTCRRYRNTVSYSSLKAHANLHQLPWIDPQPLYSSYCCVSTHIHALSAWISCSQQKSCACQLAAPPHPAAHHDHHHCQPHSDHSRHRDLVPWIILFNLVTLGAGSHHWRCRGHLLVIVWLSLYFEMKIACNLLVILLRCLVWLQAAEVLMVARTGRLLPIRRPQVPLWRLR